MAFEVVLAEVEEDRHRRRHGREQLGLEARDLEHPPVPTTGEDELRGGGAEIAPGHDLETGGAEHLRHQGGHRALAVGTGDGRQRRIGTVAPGELDLGDHVETPRLRAALSSSAVGGTPGETMTRSTPSRQASG